MTHTAFDTGSSASAERDRTPVIVVYGLYLAVSVIPFANLVGVIVAHIRVSQASGVWRDHYRFQIRTFWLSLAYLAAGVLLTIFGAVGEQWVLMTVGILILTGLAFWWLIRTIVGLIKAIDGSPIPDPDSLLLGL